MDEIDVLPTVELEPRDPQLGINQVVDLWIRSHGSQGTQRAYTKALRYFGEDMATDPQTAAQALLGGKRAATALVLAWRSKLQETKAPNTVNSRVAALRSFVRFAGSLGLVDYSLEVPNVKSRPYRDTRGPGRRGFQDLLKSTSDRRDRAILWLLYGCALRCHEVTTLDVGDLDLDGGSLFIVGKGHNGEKTAITLPAPVVSALRGWIDERGDQPGALFVNRDRARKGDGRLGNRSVRRLLRRLGSFCGVSTSPHGLRHTAITEALDATSGDLRAVQRFSRHVDVRTLQIYDDSREDLGGKVAALVAGAADLDG